MTMTLEKIKGMNIPVGAPIEVTFADLSKGLGYYIGIFEDKQSKSLYKLRFNSEKVNEEDNFQSEIEDNYGPHISQIKAIIILAPKK